ncbi:hypothetical protein GCM10023185_29590 [Hymenobacter saemangeumensis]|uniref:Uncharacterized protein n=1 Tax=Hymenobacter saemangeumensis TaxID=1084522 RepID=A0ABP8IM21_9BACT
MVLGTAPDTVPPDEPEEISVPYTGLPGSNTPLALESWNPKVLPAA